MPPRIWTHHETYKRIIARHGWIDAELYARDEREARWSIFSATAGLWLAKKLGAEVVECFGVDMQGELNWDGTPEPAATRTDQRWETERVVWEKTVNLLEAEGIEVVRHGHFQRV